jgi:hypothetical protein
MHLLKLICRNVIKAVRQIWLLLQSLANGFRQWRRQLTPSRAETERLDRIRNPSKYLGK